MCTRRHVQALDAADALVAISRFTDDGYRRLSPRARRIVAIPNGVVMATHIINYTAALRNHGLILHTRVTISYDAPWRKVHALLLAAAKATPRILSEPAPFVWQTSLDDFFVTYELNAATDHPEVLDNTYAELRQAIRDAFDAGGVEILSPHYASLRDGSRSTVNPPEKR